ncbi:transposon Tf2-9 polyprotein [Trichonephila clavipes]|nr:transposon Tf2-9 polyprotein [Trichonephila clavipes]
MYIQDRFGSYRSIEWTKTDWNCTRYSIITCLAQTSDSLARLTQTLARMPDVMDMRERNIKSELFKNIGLICGFKVCTTTSYHLQCNGKTERIHRTLKAAIRAHNSVKWTQTLPTVLLGLRSALRSDTNYTIAQMVYGQTIRLPGEFFEKPKNVLDLDTFAEEFQKQMDQLQPLRTRRQPSQKHFVHKDLHNSTHVFIRVDRVKKSTRTSV